MLEGLDGIDWAAFEHAYGPATDVPDLLRQLSLGAPDLQLRHKLFGNLHHQCSVWPASAQAVPFLVEILVEKRDDAELQQFLLGYLTALAIGFDHFPRRMNVDEHFAAEEEEDSRLAGWGLACYRAVEAQLASILPFIHSESDEVATEALSLVSEFPEQAGRILPEVRKVVARGGQRGAWAAVAIALLAPADSQTVAAFLFEKEETSALAACAAAIGTSGLPDDDAVGRLAGRSGGAEACFTLLLTRDSAGVIEALGRLLRRAPEARLVRAILTVLFSPHPSVRRSQKRALELIRDHGPFPESAPWLAERGLPETRAGLARILMSSD
jgi:hypothetical protein